MDPEQFIEFRHHLHAHPEISDQEVQTSQFVARKLKEVWPESQIETLQNFGLIASNKIDSYAFHLGFRCELDALPIEELNTFTYRSTNKGVSHKCGHDGHMAILLRLACLVRKEMPQNIKISLIFQPSEENGKGAEAVLNSSLILAEKPLDYIFSLHNVPGFDLGEIILKDDVFTPSVISAKIEFTGKTAHAAEPENGINPSKCIASLIFSFDELAKRLNRDRSICVLTPVWINVGQESYGTSAGTGFLGITIRSWDTEVFLQMKEEINSITSTACEEHTISYKINWFEEFQSVINDSSANNKIRNAANKCKNSIKVINEPFSWGEDFGAYLKNTRGAMFGLGAGLDCAALHNPNYDFPDELIQIGSDLFHSIIHEFKT